MSRAPFLYPLRVKLRKRRALFKARLALIRHGKGGFDPRTKLRHIASKEPLRGARDIILARAPHHDPCVLKVYAIKGRAAVQAAALSEVAAVSPLVVKPLFLAPDLGVCAMEWAGDVSLHARLFGADHDAAMADAGAWLSQFHTDTHQYDAALRDIPVDDSLASMRLRDPSELPPAPAQLRTALDHQIAALNDLPACAVLAHFDFNPKNLMSGPNGLRAFDRPKTGTTISEVDMAKFLSRVMIEQLVHAAQRSTKPLTLPAPSDAFIAAYDPAPERRQLLDVAIDRGLLQWWMSHIFGPPIGPARQAARDVILQTLLARYDIAPDP